MHFDLHKKTHYKRARCGNRLPEYSSMELGASGERRAAPSAWPRRVRLIAAPGRPTNYPRFRLSPNSAVAPAARVKRPGKQCAGEQRELDLCDEWPSQEASWERLLGDAMAGNGALFTREDAVEAAWAVVDPVLMMHHRVKPYKRGRWGLKEADALIAADGGWRNSLLQRACGRDVLFRSNSGARAMAHLSRTIADRR